MTKKERYRRMLMAMALVAALACGCVGREPVDDTVDSSGSLVSEEGQIAFTHAIKFNWTNWASSEADTYTINVDGSGERRLTNSPGLDGFPAWSSDGERLAFSSARDGGQSEMYVMDANGSEQRRLTHTPEAEFFFAWSPDGEGLAYTTYASDYNENVWVMDANGSNRKQLASGSLPSWSPNGERIAYTAYSGDRPYLAVMNADGSEQRRLGDVSLIRRLTGTAAAEEEPAWSPDGHKIAFASMDDGEIYAMKVNGSARTRLTNTPGYDHWPPTWSPDGTRIAFTSEDSKGSDIYVMNSDGSGLTNLTDDSAAEVFYPRLAAVSQLIHRSSWR
jgi:Tol biopolymer transport system component